VADHDDPILRDLAVTRRVAVDGRLTDVEPL